MFCVTCLLAQLLVDEVHVPMEIEGRHCVRGKTRERRSQRSLRASRGRQPTAASFLLVVYVFFFRVFPLSSFSNQLASLDCVLGVLCAFTIAVSTSASPSFRLFTFCACGWASVERTRPFVFVRVHLDA